MKKLMYFLDANCLNAAEIASDYVDSRTLVANTAKQFAKPNGARFCRLSAGALFYYRIDATATVAGADISNGTGSISVPSTVQPMFSVDDVATISVIAPAGCVVSAEWWG